MKRREYEIVFKTKIDISLNLVDKESKSIDLDNLSEVLACVIKNEVLIELQAAIEVPVKAVNIYKISEGCFEITFGVVFLISRKESVFELAMIAENAVRSLLKRRLGNSFIITVCVDNSTLMQCQIDEAEYKYYKGALFWFLLILHVALLVCAGVFIFKAVSKVCW